MPRALGSRRYIDRCGEMGSSGNRVVLAVNGARHEAAGVDPSMTLLEFLRTRTPVRGPKLGCGEGEHRLRRSIDSSPVAS